MAELFSASTDNIGLHLKNIYAEGELEESPTTEEFSVVRQEGKRQVRRQLKRYDLDAVISVGYRGSSLRATRFRQWADDDVSYGDYLAPLPPRGYLQARQDQSGYLLAAR